LKIPQIDNGIDSDLFCKFKKPIIGYAGCSSANKNWEKIKEACDNLGLEFRAAFRGKNQIPHRKMVNFYLGLDVYVLASLTEAFNNTVLEALSCNIPVIMTKTGAWKKFKGYVEFIDPTYESIYCALKKYAGRKLILEKFLWKKIMTKYRRIYETVYEKNAGR
jgi:glycosyltransferase involved in cell wall biosynthesis